MKYIKKNILNLIFIGLFIVFILLSYLLEYKAGIKAYEIHFKFFLVEMILFLPFMFILIGLGDVWISRDTVIKHIGQGSGIKGTLLVIVLSMAQAGPLYGSFPVTYLLWKKGASIRNIFMYIGAFCTIKIPMLTFEIGFLGWKFSLLRTAITLPFLFIISLGLEKYLTNKNFKINEG